MPAEHVRRGAAQQRRVVGEARDQGAARIGVEIGEIGAHQPGEERDLHIGDDALADPGHQHGLAVIGEPLDQGERERGAGDQQQQRRRRGATKMRSSTGSISQARPAVLAAASPINKKASSDAPQHAGA